MTDLRGMKGSGPIHARLATAIRSIVLEAESMAQIKDAHPRYKGYADDIAGAARHLLGLLVDAQPAAGPSAQRVNIVELADRAHSMVLLRARDKQLRFPPLVSPAQHVCGDPGHILQILVNLLGNAVKFTPERGRIDMRCHTSGGILHLDVCDTGPGVPEEAQERVFRAFERMAPSDGVGLGLAISRDLARQMQGDLLLLPSATGALFRLSLPVG